MHMRQFRADFSQPHFPGRDFVAKRAAELLKPGGFFFLIWRALIVGYLSDQIHRGEHRDTAFEALTDLPAFLRESEFPVLASNMTTLAAMRIKNIPGDFALALTGGGHPIQYSYVSLRRWPRGLLRMYDSETQRASCDY